MRTFYEAVTFRGRRYEHIIIIGPADEDLAPGIAAA